MAKPDDLQIWQLSESEVSWYPQRGKMAVQQTIQPRRQSLDVLLLIGVVAVVLVLAVLLGTHTPPRQTSTTGATQDVRAATPLSFTSFIGTVESVSGSIVTVTFQGVAADGQATTTKYAVTVDAQTVLSRFNANTTSLKLADLVAGQMVMVFADHNIANESAFTASAFRLYQ